MRQTHFEKDVSDERKKQYRQDLFYKYLGDFGTAEDEHDPEDAIYSEQAVADVQLAIKNQAFDNFMLQLMDAKKLRASGLE